jgi:hypothetical protein
VMAVYLPRIQILVVGGWVAIPSRVGRFGGPGAARKIHDSKCSKLCNDSMLYALWN